MTAGRGGFSLVELLIVLLMVGILAQISIPSYQRHIRMARAAAAVSDVQTVRLAAYAYNSDTHAWPADVNRGVVPPELSPYLQPGFTFQREHYLLDWDHWVLPDGSPQRSETGVLVGVSITTDDARFGAAFLDLLGDATARATISEHYTFVVVAAD